MRIPSNKALQKFRAKSFGGLEAVQVFDFQQRLDESQWKSREDTARYQLHHLKQLVLFAADHVEAYADGLKVSTILNAETLPAALEQIPILQRADVAADGLRYRANDLPSGHRLSGSKRSSGTTGAAISIETTNIAYGWQNALTFRSFLWAGWDFSKTIGGIRTDLRTPAPWPAGAVAESWDAATIFPFPTGAAAHLGTTSTLDQQWEWVSRIKPSYLITYPSIVRAFAARAGAERRGPCPLHGIRTLGETVDADLRDASRAALGGDIHDVYSAEEIGIIACQCPTSRRYHSQDEAVIVEILDAEGRPCRPGESGRVVLTPLFNYATPLLRYEIGDIAEAGAPCACGRGLRTINRIVGRQRNLFKKRDGSSYWPSLGRKSLSSMLDIRQHQFRQISVDRLEVILATDDNATPELEERMRQVVLKRLPERMDIDFIYTTEIARDPGGKYQETISLVR